MILLIRKNPSNIEGEQKNYYSIHPGNLKVNSICTYFSLIKNLLFLELSWGDRILILSRIPCKVGELLWRETSCFWEAACFLSKCDITSPFFPIARRSSLRKNINCNPTTTISMVVMVIAIIKRSCELSIGINLSMISWPSFAKAQTCFCWPNIIRP